MPAFLAIVLVAAISLTGCATKPPTDVERIVSIALAEPGETQLGRLYEEDIAARPGKSGVILITSGEDSFRARVGLANMAEKSLDLQYYIWEMDASGIVLAERILRAADRGVRVRILLDHMTTVDTDFRFARMDAHPNIEIRLFNPFANRKLRPLELLFSFDRLNHRMHNKAFVADNSVAIVGGRNIGDSYFGVDTAANFRDVDLAMVGPAVREVSGSFDRFWNSEFAAPIRGIVRERLSAQEFEARKEAFYRWVSEGADHPYFDSVAREGDYSLLEKTHSEIIWAPVRALYDDPNKLETKKEGVADMLISLGKAKQQEMMIESAYVIAGAEGVERARSNKEKGVRQRLLTNSLATNDVAAAHAGYAKYRRDLIRNGMELFELKPDANSITKNWSALAGRSRASLHTKLFVLDGRHVGIGSFNLDPRSIALNTEIVLLVDSAELASQVRAYMDEGVRLENSYRVTLETNPSTGVEQLVWTTKSDGETVHYYSDPMAGFWRRFGAGLLRLLPIENQL